MSPSHVVTWEHPEVTLGFSHCPCTAFETCHACLECYFFASVDVAPLFIHVQAGLHACFFSWMLVYKTRPGFLSLRHPSRFSAMSGIDGYELA